MGIQSGSSNFPQRVSISSVGFESEGLICNCGGSVDETGFCECCGNYISEDYKRLALGNSFGPEDYIPEKVRSVFNGIGSISESDIVGIYEFNGQKFECKVLSVRGIQGNFKEFIVSLGSSVLKIETNGLKIRKYASQRKTKLGRGKGTKWEVKEPAEKIKSFLESCFLKED